MYTHTEKTQENKSDVAANNLPKRQSKSESAFQYHK